MYSAEVSYSEELRSHRRVHRYIGVFVAGAAVIWLCKIYALYASDDIYSELGPLYAASVGALAAIREILAFGTLCCLGFLVTEALARCRRSQAAIEALLLIVAACILILNIINAEVLARLGTPLTLSLIEYSDVLVSEHGREAVSSWVSRSLLLFGVVAIAASAAVYVFVRVLMHRLGHLTMLVVILCGTSVVAVAALWKSPAPPNIEESGTLAFLLSLARLGAQTAVTGEHVEPPFSLAGELPELPRPQGDIRHVMVIVIEAAAAEYLDVYGGSFGVTPELSKYAPMSIVVRNAYSQSTSSTIAMKTMLSSRYPPIAQNDGIYSGPLLPALLSRAGVRTGFFHSSDTRFAGSTNFLRTAGFETVRDYRHRKCSQSLLHNRSNLLGNPDVCTFADMLSWNAKESRRSFAVLWTFQSHYPYFAENEQYAAIDLPSVRQNRARKDLRRYLAALREADRLIGMLIVKLRSLGRLDDTLLIVTADHGQAFGRHGTFGNGGSVHEESVHIPLILINPNFKRAGSSGRLAGQIDIAPTVLDAFGIQVPAGWDGASLFAPVRERPIYFSNTMVDKTVGYRLGNRKVIVNFIRGSVEIYNLSSDPNELNDLASTQSTEQIEQQRRWIAQWSNGANGAPGARH